ncbi:hypothetical protein BDQ17DRAFT_710385 [Cyathus striatus]|nr:hypothetical protein BDQ17DRAFT_710385 [Cyathus striatus]
MAAYRYIHSIPMYSLSVDIRKMIDFGDSLPKLWLKRAQNVPLDLKLTWYPVINAANSQHHKDVVDYFVSTSPRWKKLHFLLTDGPDHNSLWFHIQKLFSVLCQPWRPLKSMLHHLPATRAPNLLNFQDFRAELNPWYILYPGLSSPTSNTFIAKELMAPSGL